jgi:hypothetical protein
MKKTLITSVTALFLATGTAHALEVTHPCVEKYVMSKFNDPRSQRMRARIQEMKDRGTYEAEKNTLRNVPDVVSIRREAWRACGLLHRCGGKYKC